jgi:hypothetical protein
MKKLTLPTIVALLVIVAALSYGYIDLRQRVDVLEAPLYWPTIEDHKMVILPKDPGGSMYLRASWRRAIDQFDEYAATYVASECLVGGELSSEGFGAFVDGAFNGVSSRLWVPARDAIREIIARAEVRLESGLPLVKERCERPFLYPASGAEALLAGSLYNAATIQSVPLELQDGYSRWAEDRVAQWFNLRFKSQPLLTWLCRRTGEDTCRWSESIPDPNRLPAKEPPPERPVWQSQSSLAPSSRWDEVRRDRCTVL